MDRTHEAELNWQLNWTGKRNVWSVAGQFRTRTEAENSIVQLKKLAPEAEFAIKFIGRGISHLNEGARHKTRF